MSARRRGDDETEGADPQRAGNIQFAWSDRCASAKVVESESGRGEEDAEGVWCGQECWWWIRIVGEGPWSMNESSRRSCGSWAMTVIEMNDWGDGGGRGG